MNRDHAGTVTSSREELVKAWEDGNILIVDVIGDPAESIDVSSFFRSFMNFDSIVELKAGDYDKLRKFCDRQQRSRALRSSVFK
jgi:hypothetical protein